LLKVIQGDGSWSKQSAAATQFAKDKRAPPKEEGAGNTMGIAREFALWPCFRRSIARILLSIALSHLQLSLLVPRYYSISIYLTQIDQRAFQSGSGLINKLLSRVGL
jgi:hypothetical protein